MSAAPNPIKIKHPDVVLHVRLDPPSGAEGYCHVKGWFSRRKDAHDYGTLYPYDGNSGAHLRGVRLTSQCDTQRLGNPAYSFPFYAVSIEWDHDGNDLDSLRLGVATLGKIVPAMARVSKRFGEPQSIGQWVLRVADACGVGYIDLFNGNDYGSHREMNPADAAGSIDSRVYEWRRLAREMRGIPDVA